MTKEAGTATADSQGGAAGTGTVDDGKGAGAAGAAAGTEGKGAEGKGTEAGAGGKGTTDDTTAGKGTEGKTPAGAPEKYTLTLPEGGRLGQGDLAYIEETARKAGWSNADAQAAIEEHNAALVAQSERWIAEVKGDKDLGGDKLEATQQLTKAGIDFLFPKNDPHREEFLDFLNRGGAGNNINVVRALARIGKAQREDTPVGGAGGSGNGPRAPEDVLYGGKSGS